MASSQILIIYLFLIPLIHSYSIDDRNFNQYDVQRLHASRVPQSDFLSFENCIPVQAINELKCPSLSKADLYHGLFESVCQRHQLCYACGSEHGLRARHCDRIARLSMFELCERNRTTKIDCLTVRARTIGLLQEDIHRTSEISFECTNPCVLNYIYMNSYFD